MALVVAFAGVLGPFAFVGSIKRKKERCRSAPGTDRGASSDDSKKLRAASEQQPKERSSKRHKAKDKRAHELKPKEIPLNEKEASACP
uniref:Secreted protein n=1 Tax=Steinernema glaseri TaxID=37863 RepID=A0A1I7ZZC3_9BILA